MYVSDQVPMPDNLLGLAALWQIQAPGLRGALDLYEVSHISDSMMGDARLY